MAEIGEGVDHQDRPAPGRKKPVRIRVTLFFDGTLNSRLNTRARLAAARGDPKASKTVKQYGGAGTSYDNDLSNVARLEEQVLGEAPGYDDYIYVYTEGIGTTDYKGDSVFGYALGTGATGVPAKVAKGIYAAIDLISALPYDPARTIIQQLTVDTCGFSRGAAAARNCVYRVLNDEYGSEGEVVSASLKETLEGGGWTVGRVDVRAVGLFDTVASYGVVYWNDVFELRLDAVRDAAAVYQLAAAEEYRDNFPLTDITSAGAKGRQVYLPGAHSDIGGGYVDHDSEHQTLVSDYRAKDLQQFLLQRGWYRNGPAGNELKYDLTYEDDRYTDSVTVDQRLVGQRASIRYTYSFIPLHLMADFLRSQALRFDDTALNQRYDPGDVPGRARVEQDAKSGRPVRAAYWEATDPVLAELRHGYLHVSFHDSTGMTVRTENVGSFLNAQYRPVRKVYHG